MRSTTIIMSLAALGLSTALLSGSAVAQGYKYPVGRSANDGGFVTANTGAKSGISTAQYDQGTQKTGSLSQRQAYRSGSDRYAFGGQGQPPRSGTRGLYAYGGTGDIMV